MTNKCVVILSGGPDSVTSAYWAKKQQYDVYSLTFDYGQKAKIEIEKAVALAGTLRVKNKVIDLTSLTGIYEGVTSLIDRSITVTEEFTDPIIVPFRNGVFIAIAVAYADSIGASHIFYGAHASDEQFYPDCRREFYEAFEKAARLGTESDVQITAPYGNVPKSSIIKEAVKLGVPLEETWSCYLEGPVHCGRCESCNNRKRAFIEAGIEDPTNYKV
jgi:7-cyano-7-deazaguanine synthase